MKTNTYAESKGKKPFDWNEFLNKKTYNEKELKRAEKVAEDWATCACGTMCSIIDRDQHGQPLDKKLANLGGDFYRQIKEM